MLNADTRRSIDAARDILVGQMPDPKGQVEQITTALLYKFMDDRDRISEEEGGNPSFFIGELAQFSWRALLATTLGSAERRKLYTEAIAALGQSAELPKVFRSMFQGAFLSFQDARTLTLFLREIDNLPYTSSEDLGNGYEYLLSIMSTQGKAGQFRTPRHIINFIVAVVNPQKHERVLDPACGTAGFLISAYSHILARNKQKSPGDVLSPSERSTLSGNVHGYEIDPGMTRLSRINMFLHNIRSPQIFDYDTLTSEARWNEDYQVILANPPFMTPRGGIHPHPRFAVHAKRSEVLFVDYIAEHLTTSGRAGIIVPEGIIFQTSTAYKTLRAYLIDQWGLYAVASLPSGVFNPYSGVKTSVLFIDKLLAKQSDEILFVRIDNDGFDLGAQRRSTDKNDLPQALNILQNWQQGKKVQSDMALWVTKDKIAENGDYTLIADRYREGEDYSNAKYPMVELGDVCEILDNKRKPITKSDREKGEYPYYGATGILDYVKDYLFDEKLVLIGEDGAKWGESEKTSFIVTGKYWVNNHAHVLRPDRSKLLDELLVAFINSMNLLNFVTGVTVPKLNQANLKKIQIPLPPLEIQKHIAEEIDGYQKIIDGAKQVVDNWKPQIAVNPDWEMVELGDVCELIRGVTYSKNDEVEKNGLKVLRANNINLNGSLNLHDIKIISSDLKLSESKKLNKGDIFICLASGSKSHIGKVAYIKDNTNFYFGGFMGVIRINQKGQTIPQYMFYQLKSSKFNVFLRKEISGANINNLNSKILSRYKIPLPSLKIQKHIVAEIEKEEAIIHGNTYLIEIMEQKIKDKISEVWDNE